MTPLTDEDRRTLAHVLDELVPPSDDGRMPGAGALGLAAWVEEAARGRSELERFLARTLAALGSRGFAALERATRLELLNGIARAEPEAFRALLAVTYAGYYHQPRVVEALGLEPRPPFPKGYEVPPNDPALLDPVRRRAPFFRDC
jgi:hypothetical protein